MSGFSECIILQTSAAGCCVSADSRGSLPLSEVKVHHLTVILSSRGIVTPASAYTNLHPADQTTLLQKTADRRVASPLSEERVHQIAVILSSMRE